MTTVCVALQDGVLVAREQQGTWSTERTMGGRAAQCLAADPLRSNVVYCGTFGQGLWRSNDVGATWQPVGYGITHAEITAVAVSSNEREGDDGVVYAGTEPSALFRSVDGGASWRECVALQQLPSKATWSYPPRPWTHHVRCIGLDPHHVGHIIVCLENGALVRSTDSGATFADRTADSPKDTHTLLFHPTAAGRVYSAAGDGFGRPGHGYQQSVDSGLRWQRPDDGLEWQYGWGLAVDHANPNLVLAGMAPDPQVAHNPAAARSAIFRSTGGAWQRVETGLPPADGTLASHLHAHPTTAGRFFAANNQGVFQSTDGGQTWEALGIDWSPHYRWQHPQALLVTD